MLNINHVVVPPRRNQAVESEFSDFKIHGTVNVYMNIITVKYLFSQDRPGKNQIDFLPSLK